MSFERIDAILRRVLDDIFEAGRRGDITWCEADALAKALPEPEDLEVVGAVADGD